MRGTRMVWLVVLMGCGGGSNSDAPPAVIDSPPGPIDAPPGPDAATATCTPVSGTNVVGRTIESLGDMPLLVTAPPGDRRLFVIERTGAIQIIEDETVRATPFVDLDDNAGGPVAGGGEQGLLGLAFHPSYATNGLFYVSYTTDTPNPRTNTIAEYRRMPGDPYRADPTPVRPPILVIPDFATNHNGGMIEFGSDGYLYLATGDGGGGGDPQETGQDLNRLLGKMLRIDVDNPSGGRQYGIPASNPYAAGGGAPEVFMRGLRNPWRWSFDRGTGDIYIGDVGQGCVEEVSYVAAAQASAKDFGWDDCEGTLDFEGGGCAAPIQVDRLRPVYEEVRPNPGCGGTSNWNSVIGGQVYRGACYPDLVGRYFFSDFQGSGLYSFVISGGVATDLRTHPGFPGSPTSIHADALGELYIAYSNGDIRKIEVQ